jgi:hypothetical protein
MNLEKLTSLEKLVKNAFADRLGITPDKEAVRAFTRRFFERHNIAELLAQATDEDYLAALKAVVAGRTSRTENTASAPLAPSSADEKPKGGRKS